MAFALAGLLSRACSLHASLVQDLVHQEALALVIFRGQDEGRDLDQEAVQLTLSRPQDTASAAASLLHNISSHRPCHRTLRLVHALTGHTTV